MVKKINVATLLLIYLCTLTISIYSRSYDFRKRYGANSYIYNTHLHFEKEGDLCKKIERTIKNTIKKNKRLHKLKYSAL